MLGRPEHRGECVAELMDVTDASFARDVLASEVPVLVLAKGQVVAQLVGARPRAAFVEAIERVL
jgi:hypothetical protein